MGRAVVIVWCLAACGHLDFALGGAGGDTAGDGTTGDGAAVLSCTDLAPTCGSAGASSCCRSPLVPGGTFYRGYDVGTDHAYNDRSNPATVSDFRLDTYEATVGRFRQFVNAGMGTQQHPPPAGAGARTLNGMASQGGWDPAWDASLTSDTTGLVASINCFAAYQTWTNLPGANESMPMDCISWFEAFAFCSWDGGFLPTEAEWDYAAAGGDEQRAYPWSMPASSLAIACSNANDAACGSVATRAGSTSPAGDGRWGHADLAGNASEWTLDAYATSLLNPCDDCANVTMSNQRVVHGGGFNSSEAAVRPPLRSVANTGPGGSPWVGVRCARPP